MKSYTSHTETPSLHSQKQKVTKSQQKNTMNVLQKLLTTAEASWDLGLVSAAGVGAHRKDQNMGTTRLCSVFSLALNTQEPALLPAAMGQVPSQFRSQVNLEISEVGCEFITPASNLLSYRPQRAPWICSAKLTNVANKAFPHMNNLIYFRVSSPGNRNTPQAEASIS